MRYNIKGGWQPATTLVTIEVVSLVCYLFTLCSHMFFERSVLDYSNIVFETTMGRTTDGRTDGRTDRRRQPTHNIWPLKRASNNNGAFAVADKFVYDFHTVV